MNLRIIMLREFRQKEYILDDSTYGKFQKIQQFIVTEGELTGGSLWMGREARREG